jgi:hypothetical protein
MALEFTTSYLQDALALLRFYKTLGEGAMAQVEDGQLHAALDAEMNSIAIVVKHLHGNMRSRWIGFPTADGESPSRDRDGEFLEPPGTRAEVMALWNEGWSCVFTALEPLTDDDLGRTVTIRGEPHSVLQAIQRQLTHYAYHVGQMVFLAKHFQSAQWKSLSVPRGQSKEFNRRANAALKPARRPAADREVRPTGGR